nr:MAG TPA: hypothetical protein [Caudoviricetes sp.]
MGVFLPLVMTEIGFLQVKWMVICSGLLYKNPHFRMAKWNLRVKIKKYMMQYSLIGLLKSVQNK